MLSLGRGRSRIALAPQRPTRLLILGGAPFAGPLGMWWNFVAGSDEEIRSARDDYTAGRRFGDVVGFDGDPLEAPALPDGRLRPRWQVLFKVPQNICIHVKSGALAFRNSVGAARIDAHIKLFAQ